MNYICQSCEKEGDAADFVDLECDECGGIVVTMEEMNRIRLQHQEVMNRGKDVSWQELIEGEDEF